MDDLKSLFERAPRLRADDALWAGIERALDARGAAPGGKEAAAAPATSFPGLRPALARLRPLVFPAAAAVACALAFALLPRTGAGDEEWSEAVAAVWTEEDSSWDEESEGNDPAELVISWSDGNRKGDRR